MALQPLLGWFWFAVAAVLLYALPRFQSVRYAPAFVVIGGLALAAPPTLLAAVLLAVSFFLLLGVKEMFFIRRLAAYQSLSYVLLFLLLYVFFQSFPAWAGERAGQRAAFLFALLPSLGFWFLGKGVVQEAAVAAPRSDEEIFSGAPRIPGRARRAVEVPAALTLFFSAFFLWQLTLAALFSPLDLLRQTAVLFLAGLFLLELVPSYVGRTLTSRWLLTTGGLFVIILAVILATGTWGLSAPAW